jgi:sigma-E factor negative regulatory protein RseB
MSLPVGLPLPRRLLLCVALGAAWHGSALAQTAAAELPALPPAASGDLRARLMRIHDAASRQSFQGTFVVSAAGMVSSSRIAHFCVGGSQFESIESLDGPTRNVFRRDDTVQTVWPATRSVLIEQRDPIASFPALLHAGDSRIDNFYELRIGGAERMAGRDAELLVLKPRDRLRFGYRLWADKASGLLLRVEVIGEHSEVLESSAFSMVTIGVKPQPDGVLQAMKRVDGYRVIRPALVPTRLEAEGWSMRASIPGFEQVNCVKRPLDSLPGEDGGAAVQVLQAIYSDGLTHVSVFIEPYDAARHRRSMLTAIGATHTLMRRHGDWWLTAVGDVPGATLRQFANALDYRK